MGDVIDWKTRSVTPAEVKHGKPTDGLVLSCHCGSTLVELLNAGVVVCARCRCTAPVEWRWEKEPSSG